MDKNASRVYYTHVPRAGKAAGSEGVTKMKGNNQNNLYNLSEVNVYAHYETYNDLATICDKLNDMLLNPAYMVRAAMVVADMPTDMVYDSNYNDM